MQFKFDVCRNITILKGNSATGKTTLITMIEDYELNGRESGVELSCDKGCSVLRGPHWERDLSFIHDTIVFIDEGNKFVSSPEFARAIRGSDNYYVIVSRESLFALPYSVDEIYGIRNTSRARSKYPRVERLYSSFYRI